jgi:sugar phosphate isomerase/epimerase
MILLGGPVFGGAPDPSLWDGDPDAWARRVRALGYRAAYAPVADPGDERVDAFAAAARATGIAIAEVGVWCNLVSSDDAERRSAVARAEQLLDLADRLGARCAVTFAGTRGEGLWGPCAANFDEDTFALVVDTVRGVVDAVRPTGAAFALETMATIVPDSPESYDALVRAVDRDSFGVHFDPVNLLASPRLLAGHRELVRRFVALLGDRIVSCHAKDLRLAPDLLVHLDEVPPGHGDLDYDVFLAALSRLPHDVPLMLEHLQTADEYAAAAAFVRERIAAR